MQGSYLLRGSGKIQAVGLGFRDTGQENGDYFIVIRVLKGLTVDIEV